MLRRRSELSVAQDRATAAEMAKIQLSLRLAEVDTADDAALDEDGDTAGDTTAATGNTAGVSGAPAAAGDAAPAAAASSKAQPSGGADVSADSPGSSPAAPPQRQKPMALEADAEVLRRRCGSVNMTPDPPHSDLAAESPSSLKAHMCRAAFC